MGGILRHAWLGRVPYGRALELQRALVRARASGAGAGGGSAHEAPDALLLMEHDPVVTLGRGFAGERPQLSGSEVVEVERGGKATYHGPGQLVGYPILRLEAGDRDLHAHLRRIEDALLALLARHGLGGEREPGATGVWVRERGELRKVASIGVAVSRWVTFHGFALNVATDLRGFEGFDPCGFSSGVMTSMERLLGRALPLEPLATEAAAEMARAFGRAPRAVAAEELWSALAQPQR